MKLLFITGLTVNCKAIGCFPTQTLSDILQISIYIYNIYKFSYNITFFTYIYIHIYTYICTFCHQCNSYVFIHSAAILTNKYIFKYCIYRIISLHFQLSYQTDMLNALTLSNIKFLLCLRIFQSPWHEQANVEHFMQLC